MITVPAQGPSSAKILIIGDFPSVEDEKHQRPYSSQTGEEFSRILHEGGIIRSEVYLTFLCKHRPYMSQAKYAFTKVKKESLKIKDAVFYKGHWCSPAFLESAKKIHDEIALVIPDIIITLGEAPLWYLTGETSITKWRGSQLRFEGIRLVPTFSPAQVMKVWEWRPFMVRDLQRAVGWLNNFAPAPEYFMKIRPTFLEARAALHAILMWAVTGKVRLACDIETIARNIACVGFAWSEHDAICIPFMDKGGNHYYTLDEEVELIDLIRQVLTHPSISIIGQNFSYDTQHFVRSWGCRPEIGFDTMLAQHVCFPGIPKDLGFLASMYVKHYVYWKDELDDYKNMPDDVDKFWLYNCKDCCNTFEIAEVLNTLVDRLGFREQFDFLQTLNHHVITMMIRGVRIDRVAKDKLGLELMAALCERENTIHDICGFPLNISSPKQMKTLFYDEMGMKPVLNKKTHQPTLDAKALAILATREPLLQPLLNTITEARSVGVFLSTFVQMPLDHDKRMRCSFNVGGTETFRFSSSGDAFGSGGNLQNIPKGDEDEEHSEGEFVFPNVRRLFLPDQGMTLFDVDLAGADAQIVAWEAHDDDLKAKFRAGVKIHAENAKDMYGGSAGPDGKKQPYYKKAKMGCHLTNYGGTASTLSKSLGMTMKEAEWFQTRWFQMHPGIQTWHAGVLNSLMTTRSVRNKFGFRRFYFDRIERLLPEALAWIPQSTVAIIINKALVRISEHPTLLPLQTELLLQVHDSLVGQFPTRHQGLILPHLRDCLAIPVPYDDPLTISTSLDLSTKSWGDLVPMNWPD